MSQQSGDHANEDVESETGLVGQGQANNGIEAGRRTKQSKVFLAKVVIEQTQAQDNHQQDDNRLLVDVNDVVAIEQELDENTYLAKSDQLVGQLPKNACLTLDQQVPVALCHYLTENQFYDLHICFASFVAQDVGDLSITKGDIIVAINAVNEHWIQGQVCFDSQANSWPKLTLGRDVGTLPLNHCWQLDSERVKTFCQDKLKPNALEKSSTKPALLSTPWSSVDLTNGNSAYSSNANKPTHKPLLPANHSSSLSSGGSSSIYSSDNNNAHHHPNNNLPTTTATNDNQQNGFHGFNDQQSQKPYQQQQHDNVDSIVPRPPPRPEQLPRKISDRPKSSSEQAVSRPASILSNKQQDKLKGWLHTVKKKTTRCAMRISANLGLIALTRDEEFERHYESFKQLEKSIRNFIKNVTLFVEHFESFLLALQSTSDNLADFYRDKSYQKEISEMRKKNKALNCEHFHAFKRTVERQVIAVASTLLQRFSGPHQLIHKRSAKLLDYDTKRKEMESCRDLDKKEALSEQYVIAKNLYDRINGVLVEQLPLFNRFALDIFRECILVLLESRRSLIYAYTMQTEALLNTPLIMKSFTASEVASTIMMTFNSREHQATAQPGSAFNNTAAPSSSLNKLAGTQFKQMVIQAPGSKCTSERGAQASTSGAFGDGSSSRPSSALSQLSSEFEQMALANREICSTPLSQVSGSQKNHHNRTFNGDEDVEDENDDRHQAHQGDTSNDGEANPFDEPDTVVRFETRPGSDTATDNKQNENIETAIKASRVDQGKLGSAPPASTNGENDQQSASQRDKKKKKRTKHQIVIAVWPFVATGPNQLTIVCNQPLKLLKGCDSIGNPDWSLVKNQSNEIGYVPTAYLKKKE